MQPGVHTGARMAIALAWFPESEFVRAVSAWADDLELVSGLTYREYCEHIERRARGHLRVQGGPIAIAPIDVEQLLHFAQQHGLEAGTSAARSRYAAQLLLDGNATSWPPERNQPCWCGSGTKYKRCCGAVSGVADVPPVATPLTPKADVVDPVGALYAEFELECDSFDDDPLVADSDFDDFLGAGLYDRLVALAQSVGGQSVEQVLDRLRPLLEHELVAVHPNRRTALLIHLAEALIVTGHDQTALDVADRAIALLEADRLDPDVLWLTVVPDALIGLGRIDEAEKNFAGLLGRFPEAATTVCEMAAEMYGERGHAEPAVRWARRYLETALTSPRSADWDLSRSVTVYRRECERFGVPADEALISSAEELRAQQTR